MRSLILDHVELCDSNFEYHHFFYDDFTYVVELKLLNSSSTIFTYRYFYSIDTNCVTLADDIRDTNKRVAFKMQLAQDLEVLLRAAMN